MKIGDIVFLKPINDAARRSKELVEGNITKIGRKYVTVNIQRREYRFDLTRNLAEDTEYSSNYLLFLDKQDLLDFQEKENLVQGLRPKLDCYNFNKLSLEQLRKIAGIIGEN